MDVNCFNWLAELSINQLSILFAVSSFRILSKRKIIHLWYKKIQLWRHEGLKNVKQNMVWVFNTIFYQPVLNVQDVRVINFLIKFIVFIYLRLNRVTITMAFLWDRHIICMSENKWHSLGMPSEFKHVGSIQEFPRKCLWVSKSKLFTNGAQVGFEHRNCGIIDC